MEKETETGVTAPVAAGSRPASSNNSLSKSVEHNGQKELSSNEKEAEVVEKIVPAEGIAAGGPLSEELPEEEYPKGLRLLLITIALCLSVFCMALDNTIIATAIPKITDHFNALDDVGWYISVYLLTTCAFQLIFGKLYTFYSLKWTFMTALLLFEVGSTVCATAPTSVALIIGRAIAGLGSAGIFSGAILIISRTVPLHQRPMYVGIVGAMYGIASVAGPLMGGAFTDNPKLTWRWCFYINLPFGAVTALFLVFFFKSPKSVKKTKPGIWQQLDQMDLPGTILFLPGVICILLALQWGGTKYSWSNGRIIALFVVGGLLLVGFGVVQVIRGEKSTVPPRIFKNRNIWSTAIFSALIGGGFFVVMYYLPIWFQAIKGTSAVSSGIHVLPLILSLVIISMVAGGVITTTGYYNPWLIFCVILMPIGAGLLSTLKPDAPAAHWIGYQVAFGLGAGAGFQQPLIVAQANLPLEDIPIGTAIMMFAQIFGGSLLSSVGQNIFQNQLAKNVAAQVPGIDPTFVLSVGATQVQTQIPDQFREAVTAAYSLALDQTFYVPVACAALAAFPIIFIEWTNVKGKQFTPAAA